MVAPRPFAPIFLSTATRLSIVCFFVLSSVAVAAN
jgi:hypothetical protein